MGGCTYACLGSRSNVTSLVEDACDTNTLLEHKLCAPCHAAGVAQKAKYKKAGKGETYDQVYTRAGPYHRVANIEDLTQDLNEPGDFQMSAGFTQEEYETYAENFDKSPEIWSVGRFLTLF